MFTAQNITIKYGKKLILDDVSITANDGEAVGILGVNGSGKSTLLSSIVKTYANNKTMNIGHVPQANPLFEELKAVDNIKLWTKINKETILDILTNGFLKDLKIYEFLDVPVSKMSGGMKKRVSIATALINKPSSLLLDEPFSSLDLVAKDDILSYLSKFRKAGGTLIIASHEKEIFDFCDKIFLLNEGKLTDIESLKKAGVDYIDILRRPN